MKREMELVKRLTELRAQAAIIGVNIEVVKLHPFWLEPFESPPEILLGIQIER
jgi:hypothetical protein